jgi:hypothetical protein
MNWLAALVSFVPVIIKILDFVSVFMEERDDKKQAASQAKKMEKQSEIHEKELTDEREQTQAWADRPRTSTDAVKRLRDLAKQKRTDRVERKAVQKNAP